MDYVTRQFIFLAKKLRKELREAKESLHRDLMRLSDRLKDIKDTVSAQRQTGKEINQTDPSISISDFRTNLPIPIQNKAKKTIPEWAWVTFKGTLEIVGIMAVVIYTGVAYEQLQASIDATNFSARQTELSRKGLNETVKNFRLDERPYVTVSSVVFDSALEPERGIGLSIIADNSGHTPALKVRFSGAAYLDGNMVEGQSMRLKAESVILSGHSTTAHYIVQFSEPDLAHVKSGTSFKIQGTIQYSDIFNESHPSTYCATYDGNRKQFTLCNSGNEVK